VGMSTAGWASGTGTSQPQVVAGALNYVGDPAFGDRVVFNGTNDGTVRTLARNLSPALASATGSTFYFSGLFQRDSVTTLTSDGFSLMGFANTVAPTATTSGSLTGFYFGYSMNGTAGDFGDLVLRTRVSPTATTIDTILVNDATTSTVGSTYEVVAKIQVNNFSGNQDTITYWVNPSDTSSESAMSSTSLASGSVNTFAMQGTSSDLIRLELAQKDFDGNVEFDEPRLGTTLDAVVVPEPTMIGLIALAAPMMIRRRRA
jgi:hypothetical protein